MEDDDTKNPETDSFHYIHLILESLNRLGHLDAAVDTIEHRLPVELFTIVERTNQEVDLRHPSHLRNSQSLGRGPLNLQQQDGGSRNDVLNDLLWTLYSKFEAIAEGHRAVHDVILGIATRDGLGARTDLSGSFKEMWKLYQSEVIVDLRPVWVLNDCSRCAPCCTIIWQPTATLLRGSVGCKPWKPMYFKKVIEIK